MTHIYYDIVRLPQLVRMPISVNVFTMKNKQKGKKTEKIIFTFYICEAYFKVPNPHIMA